MTRIRELLVTAKAFGTDIDHLLPALRGDYPPEKASKVFVNVQSKLVNLLEKVSEAVAEAKAAIGRAKGEQKSADQSAKLGGGWLQD